MQASSFPLLWHREQGRRAVHQGVSNVNVCSDAEERNALAYEELQVQVNAGSTCRRSDCMRVHLGRLGVQSFWWHMIIP